MKFTLINPNWKFDNSVYFGCREPHLPLEFGYAKNLLEQQGHEAAIIDGHFWDLSPAEIYRRVAAGQPDYTIVTTAPNYLFWRCPPPELRVPRQTLQALGAGCGTLIAVGPHGSVTPAPVLAKLGVELVIAGEFEEVLVRLAREGRTADPAIISRETKENTPLQPAVADLDNLPPLTWPDEWLQHHRHHHHRFDASPRGPGAELEASRGCPYACTFCAKENFRGKYRQRPHATVLQELDNLVAQQVEYIYFIDEIFLPNEELLQALLQRPVKFGIQTRLDLWNAAQLKTLGQAGCVSIEAGVESITPEGRQRFNKKCRHSTAQLTELLLAARRYVPFVQANLIRTTADDQAEIESWRWQLRMHGIWANDPVPLFPYPGSPAYRLQWGEPDDQAWERAHADYLQSFGRLSDLQEDMPLPLAELETITAEVAK